MLSVSINVQGTEQEINKLKKLGTGLLDFTGAMRTVGERLVHYYSGEAFASQGGVFSSVWQSLNPEYAARKAKLYPGRGVLVATGAMQNAFTSDSNSKSVVIGNKSPYFKYHQSTESRTKMPYRPMMQINNNVKDIIREVIEADITRKISSL